MKFLRILVMVSIALLYGFGGAIYGRTLTDWWVPVLVALVIALITLSFCKKWAWFTETSNHILNALFHLVALGAVGYFLFLAGNYYLSDSASMRKEKVIVQEKYIETHERRRKWSTAKEKVRNYYIQVVFEDGKVETFSVSSATYHKAREGKSKTLTLQKGFFGLPVITQGI